MFLHYANSVILSVCGVAALSFGAHVSAATTPESSSLQSYIVLMHDKPILLSTSNQGRKLNRKSANSNANKKYKKYLKNKHDQVSEAAGISKKDMAHGYYYCSNGFQAFMTKDQANEMSENPDVVQVVKDRRVGMDKSGSMSNSWGSRRLSESSLASDIPITRSVLSAKGRPPKSQDLTGKSADFIGLNGPAGPWARGYDGEGVVVGVIDSGLWPEHPSFADDGTYPSLPDFVPNSESLPCDFGNTEHNVKDAAFNCTNKLLGARLVMDAFRKIEGGFDPEQFDSARDDTGHGTHTASTAVGNRDVAASINSEEYENAGNIKIDLGKISGIAPRARIIAYKAIEVPPKKGGYDSDLMKAVDYACQDGVDVINYSIGGTIGDSLPSIVTIAFLNAAKAGILVAAAAGNDGPDPSTTTKPAPWYTVVASSTQPNEFQGSVSSDVGGWEYFGVSITGGTEKELPLVDGEDVGSEDCFPGTLIKAKVQGKIVLCKKIDISGIYISLEVSQLGGLGMILYNDKDDQSSEFIIGEIPSMYINNSDGLRIKEYIKTAGTEAVAQITVPVPDKDAPVVADSSSRGPKGSPPDIIRPDITAPGVDILAGYSPKSKLTSPKPGLFAFLSGTSMATPHITGTFALMRQAHPDWTPAMVKSAIMTTSYQNVSKIEDGSLVQAKPFDMGSGHVNVGKINKGSIFEPGLVYDAGYDDYVAFLCGVLSSDDLSKYNPSSTCEELESQGISTEAFNLNYPSIGIAILPGIKSVTRTVTSVAKEKGYREYDAVVENPEGYEVLVTPSTIRLKQGEIESFEVTVTRQDASLDVWKFGSLTWIDKSSKYEVYSPIAVKQPFLLDYQRSDSGSGVVGTSSFDLFFGYTGSYTAKANGLVPATIKSGTFDQIFDGGAASYVSFDIPSGVALFAIAIPSVAIGNVITILIYKPNTNVEFAKWVLVEGLNSKGVIKIPQPYEEGEWNMIIKSEMSNATYELYSWIIGDTPDGGSLSKDAPTSAVAGQTTKVDIAWEGATLNEWYLGVISHIGNDEAQLGVTIIIIDNRDDDVEVVPVVSQVSKIFKEPSHEQPTSSSNMFNQVSVWMYVFMPAMMMMMMIG